MIVVSSQQIGSLFESTVLPDYPGAKLIFNKVLDDEVVLKVSFEGQSKAALYVARPADDLIPLIDTLENLEKALNDYIDTHGVYLEYPGNPDWN